MDTFQDPIVPRRRLRVELKRAREMAALTQEEVARAMGWSPSKIIRIEGGQVSISINDLRALLNYYGATVKTPISDLLDLARASRGGSFYQKYDDLLKPGFREYLAHETAASVIRQYDPILIPGLLQTKEYSKAILNAVGLDPNTVDKAWTVRQRRQKLYVLEKPPDMFFIVDEAALRRHIGGSQVMRHQLEKLKEFWAATHITLQVLTFACGAHPGVFGNFILLEFADADLDDLVHLEGINSVTIRDDAELIKRYLDRFLDLEQLALPPVESAALLDKMIGEMSSPTK
jgi:transcriptional regulator with XRE-family HTH domain